MGTDIYFEGYVSQRDSKNVTKKSEVATYLSSETSMFAGVDLGLLKGGCGRAELF